MGKQLKVLLGITLLCSMFATTANAKFLSIDPVQFDPNNPNPAHFNRYAYANNDPINGIDPFGLECINASDGQTTCSSADYNVSFPTPDGFQNTDPSANNFHSYEVQGQSHLGASETREFVVNNPTPGNPAPATPQGTYNDANPFGGNPSGDSAPVMSFTTTNTVSGNQVVVNATLPTHPLGNGVVIRDTVPNGNASTIRNFGEGNGALQQPNLIQPGIRNPAIPNPAAPIINGVWRTQVPFNPNKVCQSCP